jgi:hypothetical protein
MTATVRAYPAARPSPLETFAARCEARAVLWQAGELTLHEAVDVLWSDAVASELVAALGDDEIQRLMAGAFAAVRDDLPKSGDMVPDDISAVPTPRSGAAASTLMAAEFLVREGDAARLRNWLEWHSADERAAIYKHLGRRACR